MGDGEIIVRTSDRQLFKRCRRKWAFMSALRMNREPMNKAGYFWIGSGGHFALEDYHGYNRYGHPSKAFEAYVIAQKRAKEPLPDDFEEQYELGLGLMEYYLTWLTQRDPLPPIWIDGEPQVEVRAQIPIPDVTTPEGYNVAYDATFDKVCRIDGELWIVDYKFFKQFYPTNLDFDEQATSYLWAASVLYGEPVVGLIFQQHKKDLPKPPRILANGQLSTDKKQNTTHRQYREVILEHYGAVNRAPGEVIETLNTLAAQETEDMDKFIKRESTRRNQAQLESAGDRILMELEEMTNPNTSLYPNFTKDCSWDCPLSDVCIMVERDEMWEDYLHEITESKTEQRDSWREHLPSPDEL